MKELLVLGIGNVILKDEGVGIHVIHEIEKNKLLSSEIDIMDGATGGYFLLNDIIEYKKVILVDAALEDSPVGTINIIHPEYSSDYPPLLSAHEFGLKNMIDAMIFLETISDMYLVTISANEFQEMSMDLSPKIKSCLPQIIDTVVDLANNLYQESKTECEILQC